MVNPLFWQAPCAQALRFIALVIGVSGFFQQDDQKLRYYLTFFMALHFFVFEQRIGALIALFRKRSKLYFQSYRQLVGHGLIFVGAWFLATPNADEWVHLLPVIGTTFGIWHLAFGIWHLCSVS